MHGQCHCETTTTNVHASMTKTMTMAARPCQDDVDEPPMTNATAETTTVTGVDNAATTMITRTTQQRR